MPTTRIDAKNAVSNENMRVRIEINEKIFDQLEEYVESNPEITDLDLYVEQIIAAHLEQVD